MASKKSQIKKRGKLPNETRVCLTKSGQVTFFLSGEIMQKLSFEKALYACLSQINTLTNSVHSKYYVREQKSKTLKSVPSPQQ